MAAPIVKMHSAAPMVRVNQLPQPVQVHLQGGWVSNWIKVTKCAELPNIIYICGRTKDAKLMSQNKMLQFRMVPNNIPPLVLGDLFIFMVAWQHKHIDVKLGHSLPYFTIFSQPCSVSRYHEPLNRWPNKCHKNSNSQYQKDFVWILFYQNLPPRKIKHWIRTWNQTKKPNPISNL